MKRLLADAEELTGIEYNIESLADVYNAIHAIQVELGVAGTTAKEASSTISGSASSMKAAFTNVLGDLSSGEALSGGLNELLNSMTTFLTSNLMPMLMNVMQGFPLLLNTFLGTMLPQMLTQAAEGMGAFAQALMDIITIGLIGGLGSLAPTLIPAVVSMVLTFATTILENVPLLLDTAVRLVEGLARGISDAIPLIVAAVPSIINAVVVGIFSAYGALAEAWTAILTSLDIPAILRDITSMIPQIIISAVMALLDGVADMTLAWIQLFASLLVALPEILLSLVMVAPEVVSALVSGIIEEWPQMKQAGQDLIAQMGRGLSDAWGNLKEGFADMWARIKEYMTTGWRNDMINVAKNLIEGLVQGIQGNGGAAKTALQNVAKSAVSGVKSFLGIRSPSRVMADVGRMLDAGLAVGIEGDANKVDAAMRDVASITTGALAGGLTVDGAANGNAPMSQLIEIVAGLSDKLDRLQVVLDTGAVVGGVVPGIDGKLSDRTILAGRGIALT